MRAWSQTVTMGWRDLGGRIEKNGHEFNLQNEEERSKEALEFLVSTTGWMMLFTSVSY